MKVPPPSKRVQITPPWKQVEVPPPWKRAHLFFAFFCTLCACIAILDDKIISIHQCRRLSKWRRLYLIETGNKYLQSWTFYKLVMVDTFYIPPETKHRLYSFCDNHFFFHFLFIYEIHFSSLLMKRCKKWKIGIIG